MVNEAKSDDDISFGEDVYWLRSDAITGLMFIHDNSCENRTPGVALRMRPNLHVFVSWSFQKYLLPKDWPGTVFWKLRSTRAFKN